MNYRELLKKYMSLVIGRESIDYLRFANDPYVTEAKFTDAEIDELKKMVPEARRLAGH